MQFQLFERKSRPTTTVPVIALQTRGTMSLNSVAFEMLMSTKTAATAPPAPAKAGKQTAKTPDGADALIEFLYAKDEQAIGIRLAADGSMNAYPIRKQQNSETYLVTAKAFLGYHGIQFPELRRFRPRLHEGMLVFTLKEDGVT
jgi:hypothetical protein